MGFFRQQRSRYGRCIFCVVVVVTGLGPMAGSAAAFKGGHRQAETGRAAAERVEVSPWESALRTRADFEAQPQGTHTRAEYAHVMDRFRVIYHGDPSDVHAPRAVVQVAELLAEEGRELSDRKSLRDAAGQYEFVAKAYPGASLAPIALGQALDLLGPDAADDPSEAHKVRAQLLEDYPSSAVARAVRASANVASPLAGKPRSQGHEAYTGAPLRPPGTVRTRQPVPTVRIAPEGLADSSGAVARTSSRSPNGGGQFDRSQGLVQTASAVTGVANSAPETPARGPVALITGIRHWSTSTYTRVAIDLSVDSDDGVKYQAARVQNPDRIYFDLHHAKLAPQLAGKTFNVTDDGFLTKIRAAQFSGDMTRVVLDVHEVSEYSAFLLPNPYRLIIDIHGRPNKPEAVDSAEAAAEPAGGRQKAQSNEARAVESGRSPAGWASAASTAAESSSLPPMPVTDASTAFGLTPKPGAGSVTGVKVAGKSAGSQPVARPRVVVSSKPTFAKPVPNTVTARSSETGAQFGTELAAVSQQSGKVEATNRPTSQPIVSKSVSSSQQADGSGDHYRPRSKRSGAASTAGGSNRGALAVVSAAPAEAAPPTADGETSMVRALGLKIGRIVIDAGHGGHDSGTLGVGGIEEKDVVLDVALRLGKLLHDRLGAEIVYTRADDTFIPLETRTAIANKAQADLFISVHANSSQDASARGVEVYYLNFTSDPDAMRVAARENAVSTQSVHELSDLVKQIALKDKIDESRELASDVDTSLFAGLTKGNPGLKNRGVKKAPFVVLIGANMPSILAEISFVTNPDDAEKLQRPEYRERVAESLYAGVARYAASINGTEPRARTTEQAER